MNEHERDVIARLSRIEEQNRQIIAMLSGQWTAFGEYVDQQSPHYGQLLQQPFSQNLGPNPLAPKGW